MILAILLAVPFITGLLCLWVVSRRWAQRLSYIGLAVSMGIAIMVGLDLSNHSTAPWLLEISWPWIPSWRINFHLGLDRLSYWLIVLTIFLGALAIFASFPKKRVGSYFASINWAIFGAIGLFLSADLLLFFVFWELALLPIYWILFVEGESLKLPHVLRFIILTQSSGLILLVGIMGLVFEQAKLTGSVSFAYASLMNNTLSPSAQSWLFLCFIIAFLIKLPAFPFHGWMPALFSEGPAAVIVVAILVKTSVFGLLRFSWMVFPDACADWANPLMILGAITVLYGAILAFSQNDPRRVLGYGTLSHAGLLLIGIMCQHHASFYGVILLLTSSALSTTAMLIIFEQRRLSNLAGTTGLWKSHPKLSVVLLIMVLAGMGFPLFGNFVGEWLILWSVFTENIVVAIITSFGIILSAAYGLRLFQRLCLGDASRSNANLSTLPDLSPTELSLCAVIAVVIIVLGLSPALAFNAISTPFAHKGASSVGMRDTAQVVLP